MFFVEGENRVRGYTGTQGKGEPVHGATVFNVVGGGSQAVTQL